MEPSLRPSGISCLTCPLANPLYAEAMVGAQGLLGSLWDPKQSFCLEPERAESLWYGSHDLCGSSPESDGEKP